MRVNRPSKCAQNFGCFPRRCVRRVLLPFAESQIAHNPARWGSVSHFAFFYFAFFNFIFQKGFLHKNINRKIHSNFWDSAVGQNIFRSLRPDKLLQFSYRQAIRDPRTPNSMLEAPKCSWRDEKSLLTEKFFGRNSNRPPINIESGGRGGLGYPHRKQHLFCASDRKIFWPAVVFSKYFSVTKLFAINIFMQKNASYLCNI